MYYQKMIREFELPTQERLEAMPLKARRNFLWGLVDDVELIRDEAKGEGYQKAIDWAERRLHELRQLDKAYC